MRSRYFIHVIGALFSYVCRDAALNKLVARKELRRTPSICMPNDGVYWETMAMNGGVLPPSHFSPEFLSPHVPYLNYNEVSTRLLFHVRQTMLPFPSIRVLQPHP